MNYYKLINDNTIFGVVTENAFVKYSPQADSYIHATDQDGEYVGYKSHFYRDRWMQPVQLVERFEQVIIDQISEEEYLILKEAFETNEEIVIEPDDDEPEQPIIPDQPDNPDITLEFVRSSKINEMSHACRTAIESGIDFQVHGRTKHFSLTTQDQLNLMSAQTMAQTQALIPYHADGEETAFYTSEEINQIAEAVAAFKVRHTTYYNSLKTYINALETIEEIAAITYGVEIPDEYKSDVLKVLEQ